MRKKMLSVIGLVVVAIAIASPLHAQGRRGGGQNLDEQMTALSERLELSEQQASEVRKIIEAQNGKRREMFQDAAGDRSVMRAVMGEIREETTALLGEVLNEDQLAEYAKIQEERRQRRRPPID